MQNHDQYLKLASLYADNELQAEALSQFQQHLQNCTICREETAFYTKAKSALEKSSPIPVSADTELSLSDFAMEESQKRGLMDRLREIVLFHPLRVQLAFQIILLLIGLEIGMLSYNPAPDQRVTPGKESSRSRAGLFDAVYPGSFAHSYLAVESQHEK
jgi:hypothetical protein